MAFPYSLPPELCLHSLCPFDSCSILTVGIIIYLELKCSLQHLLTITAITVFAVSFCCFDTVALFIVNSDLAKYAQWALVQPSPFSSGDVIGL